MWKRGSLGVGLALCACGVFFALAPTTSALFGGIARFWPIIPLLIGIGSIVGFALKRQPRSPWGGAILIVVGALALAATLQSALNPLALYGRYWPVLLGVIGLVEVTRHYTRRMELGERPAFLSVGKVALVGVVVATGFTANRLAEANPNIIANISMPSGLSKLRDNMFGAEFTFDKLTARAELPVSGTVSIANKYGDVTIEATDGTSVIVEVTPTIRAYDHAAASSVAGQLQLRATADAAGVSVGTNRDAIDHQLSTNMKVLVPRSASINLAGARGDVAISGVQAPNGRIDIEASHGALRVMDVQAAIDIKSDYDDVNVAQSSGSLAINGRNEILVTGFNGQIRLEDSDEVTLRSIVSPLVSLVSVDAATVVIDGVSGLDDATPTRVAIDGSNTGVRIKNIKGDVAIRTSREEIEAVDITGKLDIDASRSDVSVLRVGSVTVKTDHDSVSVKDVAGAVDITNDHGEVNVNDFRSDCRVRTTFDDVRLAAGTKHDGDVDVENEHGAIDVRLPAGGNYAIQPDVEKGKVRIDPAFSQAANASGTERRVTLKTSYETITVRPATGRTDGSNPA